MNIRVFLVSTLMIWTIFLAQSQESDDASAQLVYRFMILNPGVEVAVPIGEEKVISLGLGFGYGGGYPNLSSGPEDGGLIYVLSPFLDTQIKWLYNLKARNEKGKPTARNSSNYISMRGYARGPSVWTNIERTTNYDIAIGPTWGLQRTYGKRLHILLDMGPIYYMDFNGLDGFFPLLIQLNLGINLN